MYSLFVLFSPSLIFCSQVILFSYFDWAPRKSYSFVLRNVRFSLCWNIGHRACSTSLLHYFSRRMHVLQFQWNLHIVPLLANFSTIRNCSHVSVDITGYINCAAANPVSNNVQVTSCPFLVHAIKLFPYKHSLYLSCFFEFYKMLSILPWFKNSCHQ
jgi:hypothetical protein